MKSLVILIFSLNYLLACKSINLQLPLVINTWNFSNATIQAWDAVNRRNIRAIDSIVEGCSVCEREQCDGTVGYGGSPDEHGETTLDAMIMDGKTMNIGAVAALRNIKNAIEVARHVLENTKHTLIVGEQATEFAVMMGFKREPLSTETSQKMWTDWTENNCQPNFWENVVPNPSMSCGPYSPVSDNSIDKYFNVNSPTFDSKNHDTIGMIVIDQQGNISAGTSTNGARNKIPGRVGDSPIPGAGAYADNNVGAASATGDGDIMMRFLPSLMAVEHMRNSKTPKEAAELALKRIALFYPNFMGAIVVADKKGNYAAACHGFNEFPYSVYNPETKDDIVKRVKCFTV